MMGLSQASQRQVNHALHGEVASRGLEVSLIGARLFQAEDDEGRPTGWIYLCAPGIHGYAIVEVPPVPVVLFVGEGDVTDSEQEYLKTLPVRYPALGGRPSIPAGNPVIRWDLDAVAANDERWRSLIEARLATA